MRSRRCDAWLATLVAAVAASSPAVGAPTPAQPGFQVQAAFTGLRAPTAVSFAPDGRVFVAEKGGRIKVFPRMPAQGQPPIDATTVPTFADLSADVQDYWDRGLLGIAVAPSWPTDRRLFVLYSRDVRWSDRSSATPQTWGDGCPNPPDGLVGGCAISQRLSVLTATANPNVADGPATELIQDWCMQFPSHAIGTVAFGPDGRLYVSGGEGASFTKVDYGQYGAGGGQAANPCGDPPGGVGGSMTPPTAEGGALRAQDILSPGDPAGLGGTIIRVDPSSGSGVPGNPLFGSSDPNVRRIIATGLRNPFRFAFRPGTDELWTGDVGWEAVEELNQISSASSRPSVANLGWPCREGANVQAGYGPTGLSLCSALTGAQNPSFTWARGVDVAPGDAAAGCPAPGQGGASSTGVALRPRTGGSYPAAYSGALFFADYSRRCVWSIPDGNGGQPNPAGVARFVIGTPTVQLSAEPASGDIVGVDIGDPFAGGFDGSVYRVRAIGGGNQPPTARATANPSTGGAPLAVTLSGSGSSDPEGGALSYSWDIDGDGAGDLTGATVARTFGAGLHRVALTVTDPAGLADSAIVSLTVGAPPEVAISAPSPAATWSAGQQVAFSGSAVDPQDGPIPTRSLRWTFTIRHCEESRPDACHEHVTETREGVASGSFTAPDHDWPSQLLVSLRAVDSTGGVGSTTVRIDPLSAETTFASEPSGARVTLGAVTRVTPFTKRFVVGATTTITAESPQTFAGATRDFLSWSDGGGRSRTITFGPSPGRITARFDGPPVTATGGPCAAGQLFARYFSGASQRGTPALSRCERRIAKRWGLRRPVRGVPADGFSADWAGVVALRTRRTSFRVVAVGGVRLWVDGRLRLNAWSARRVSRDLTLPLGRGRHRIRVAYRDRGGDAAVQVTWRAR